MRILWVNVSGLWPPNAGGRLRSFHILGELSRRHQVTVVTTRGVGDDPDALAAALSRCEQVMSVPHAAPKPGEARFVAALLRSWLSVRPVHFWRWRVPALRRKVEAMLASGGVDLCVADFLNATPNIPTAGPTPIVFFAHNVEHVIWKRMGRVDPRLWWRTALALEWRKMRRWEAHACAQASLTLAVSPRDRDMLAALAPGARVFAIPTGVDPAHFAPNGVVESPAHLVFTGSMDWYPNEDAILYFLDEILPAIRREIPAVSFTVAGRNPTPRLRSAAAASGVRVTGTVDDIRPHIAEAAVYVVPLRIGGGTRLKLFEALAMGKAVVSTKIGAEGLPLTAGRHFVAADDPAAFASATVSLLRDPGRRKALGDAGRRLVTERYSWSQVAREFEARCEELVTRHAR